MMQCWHVKGERNFMICFSFGLYDWKRYEHFFLFWRYFLKLLRQDKFRWFCLTWKNIEEKNWYMYLIPVFNIYVEFNPKYSWILIDQLMIILNSLCISTGVTKREKILSLFPTGFVTDNICNIGIQFEKFISWIWTD